MSRRSSRPRPRRSDNSNRSSHGPHGSPDDDRETVPPPKGVIVIFVLPIVLLILWAMLVH